jgi:hypothetical protein
MERAGLFWWGAGMKQERERERERGVYVIDPLLEARSADKDDRYRILQH